MADNQSFRFIKRKETPISPFNDRALIASTSEGIGAGMSDRDKAKIEHEKSETIKDIAQFTLDLTGILDPTPVSDGTNALISLGRGNWVDAFISVVSIVPFIGDVAKLGKFSRYLDSIRKAIKIAEKDGVWAIALTKLLKPLRKFIDQLIKVFGDPPKKLLQIKDEIDRFMPSTMDGAAPGGRIVNPRANPANQARKSRIDKAADGGRIESGGVKNVGDSPDWDAVVPKKGKYKGQSRSNHVRLHNKNNTNKDYHGVFDKDAVSEINTAWKRAKELKLEPDKNGLLRVPMDRKVGYEGGKLGSGKDLDTIEIRVVPGTSNIITGYPAG